MPCRAIQPELETLVASHPDVQFVTVDLSQEGHEVRRERAGARESARAHVMHGLRLPSHMLSLMQ